MVIYYINSYKLKLCLFCMGKYFFTGNFFSLRKCIDKSLSEGKLLWFHNSYYEMFTRSGLLGEGDVVIMPNRLGEEKECSVGADGKMYPDGVVFGEGKRFNDIFAVQDVSVLLKRLEDC